MRPVTLTVCVNNMVTSFEGAAKDSNFFWRWCVCVGGGGCVVVMRGSSRMFTRP